MGWLRRWLRGRRARRRANIRRVIVLVIDGLEPALVEELLGQGLLPNLALLRDVGTYAKLSAEWAHEPRLDWQPLRDTLRDSGVPSTLFEPIVVNSTGLGPEQLLSAVIVADNAQQQAMFTTLRRTRRGLVVGAFDAVELLRPTLTPLLARDMHVRMDELVGKTASFLDDDSVLLVIGAPDLRFCSRKFSAAQVSALTVLIPELFGVMFDQ